MAAFDRRSPSPVRTPAVASRSALSISSCALQVVYRSRTVVMQVKRTLYILFHMLRRSAVGHANVALVSSLM